MEQRNLAKDLVAGSVLTGRGIGARVKARNIWEVECFGPDGTLKWKDSFKNLVTNGGLDHILDAVIAAGSQITTWYVGLTASSPTPAAADTMASHAGWTEDQNYSEGVRQTYTPGSVSSQSVDNSASKATFSINGSTTIGGAFLVSNSTKGGSTGTLYCVGAFSGGNKSVGSGDTLQVTITLTQADDGA